MEGLCWIDIETTGLNPNRDLVLEIGCKITDFQYNDLYTFHMWVNNPREPHVLSLMEDMVYAMHRNSGLFDEAENVDVADFYAARGYDQLDIDFSGHLDFASKSHGLTSFHPAGSSVHFDMSFLRALGLPQTMDKLHHRYLDVTSLKLFMQTLMGFYPDFPKVLPEHRAISDIETSILVAKQIAIPGLDTSLEADHTRKVIDNRLDTE